MANVETKIDSVRPGWAHNREERVLTMREEGKDRHLVLWIGPAERDAVDMKLQGFSTFGPLTHDSACAAIDALGGRVKPVVIDKLENDICHAEVIITGAKGQGRVDRRPFDAMAMAVRQEPSSWPMKRCRTGQVWLWSH